MGVSEHGVIQLSGQFTAYSKMIYLLNGYYNGLNKRGEGDNRLLEERGVRKIKKIVTHALIDKPSPPKDMHLSTIAGIFGLWCIVIEVHTLLPCTLCAATSRSWAPRTASGCS